jgi:Tfp pilus assembly protein PilN
MNTIICTYCEGNDTKIIVVTRDKNHIKVHTAATFDVVQSALELEDSITGLKIDGDELSFEGTSGSKTSTERSVALSSISLINDALKNYNLKKSLFIPAITEPSIYYHLFEGSKVGKSSKVTQDIIDDIQASKNITIDKEDLGYTELADKSLLAVFLSGEVSCIKLISSLAHYNGKRYYKIPTVKSAEISLAYYVAKKKKFFPDDQSLIVYIGKENSKLIFLQGRKLKHIGSTLDIGTINLHTYDVYFSKILLEMENGGITALDNIIVCGEDDSENLILSFYGTFPEANVSRLQFDDLDFTSVDANTKEKFSSFSVPVAVAQEYFDELAETYHGINLLPRYVKEEQKAFQFAWHGFAMLPLLFFAAFFITLKILVNQKEINQLDTQISEQTIKLRQNQAILNKISDLQGKIGNFSQTQVILDSASVGTGIWSKTLEKISHYIGLRKNIWITKLAKDDAGKILLEGYALNRDVLTDFAFSIETAELKSVTYESLRERNVYKFNIVFNSSGTGTVNKTINE